jgi:protein-disulfide isomerase
MRSALPLVLATVATLAACGGASSSSPAAPTSTYVIPAGDLSEMLSEKVMGNPAAAVSILEYSSLTCPHCATFHVATLPLLKTAYIDTGKVKLLYRDFPVPGASSQAAAFAAAALARCAGNARYFEAVDLLYRSQGSWTAASNPYTAMKQSVASLGMTGDKMDACMASADIKNEISRVMTEGSNTYGVTGTPTFVFSDGQRIIGSGSYGEFDAILTALIR